MTGHYPSDQTGKPIVDRNLALKACCSVAQSILSSKTNSQLDKALKQSLSYHEDLLKQAELSKSNEIVEMASKIENMKSERIIASGIISKLKNGLLSLRVKIREIQLNSKYADYVQRKHLLKVSTKYLQATESIIGPELGWYIIARPELDLNIVESELISLDESIQNLDMADGTNCFHIGKQKIAIRNELNKN